MHLSVFYNHVSVSTGFMSSSDKRVHFGLGQESKVASIEIRWPRMPSADQVQVKTPLSTMRWHMWVVLIAGSTGTALRAVRPPNLHIRADFGRDLVYAASAAGSL